MSDKNGFLNDHHHADALISNWNKVGGKNRLYYQLLENVNEQNCIFNKYWKIINWPNSLKLISQQFLENISKDVPKALHTFYNICLGMIN